MELILDKQLNFKQKSNLLILNVSLLLILLGSFSIEASSKIKLFQLLLFFALIVLFSILLLKKGLSIKNDELYYCYFLFNMKLFHRKITIENFNNITTLIYNKKPEYAYFIGIYPIPGRKIDQSMQYSYKSFEIHLLNKKHTIKKKIIELYNDEYNKEAVKFIAENLNLKFEKYSPDFN